MQITAQQLTTFTGHTAGIYALLPLSESTFLAADGNGWLVQWTLHTPEQGQLLAKAEQSVFSLCQYNDALYAGMLHGGLHGIYAAEPSRNSNILAHQKGLFAIRQWGDFLYTIGGDGNLCKWQLQPVLRKIESLRLSAKALRSMLLIGNDAYVGSSDGNIYIVALPDMNLQHVVKQAHTHSVFSLTANDTLPFLYSGGRDAQLRQWNIVDKTLQQVVPAHLFTINAMTLHPTLPLLATGSRDKSIKLWDAISLRLLKVLTAAKSGGHTRSVNSLAWLNAQTLISGSDDRQVMAWNIEGH